MIHIPLPQKPQLLSKQEETLAKQYLHEYEKQKIRFEKRQEFWDINENRALGCFTVFISWFLLMFILFRIGLSDGCVTAIFFLGGWFVAPMLFLLPISLISDKSFSLKKNRTQKKDLLTRFLSTERALERYNTELSALEKKYPGLKQCNWNIPLYNGIKLKEFLDWIPSMMEESRHIYNKNTIFANWEKCTNREFEEKTEQWYLSKGYDVFLTPKSGDGGVDVIAHKNENKIYIQCKQYHNKAVPVETVRELYGVMCADNINTGVIVCIRGATKGARDFANNHNIRIITTAEICQDMLKNTTYQHITHTISDSGPHFKYSGWGTFQIIGEPFDSTENLYGYIKKHPLLFKDSTIKTIAFNNLYFIVFSPRHTQNLIAKKFIHRTLNPNAIEG